MNRIFYFAPVEFDEISAIYGEQCYSGAASNKVRAVAKSLTAQSEVFVVSGVGIKKTPKSMDDIICSDLDGFKFIYCIRRTSGWSAFFSKSLFFSWVAIRYVRRGDQVVLYNFFPYYLFCSLLLAIRGARPVLDIEDGPRPTEPGLRARAERLSFGLLKILCRKRFLVVSNMLGENLGLHTYLPVYGVSEKRILSPRFGNANVIVLYGGSIQPETGLDMFIEALFLLDQTHAAGRFEFIVTGKYDEVSMSQRLTGLKNVSVKLLGSLTLSQYHEVLQKCDVGLCLKLSQHEMGKTTFPSKVIEYCSQGLLVVTTPVSDVPTLLEGGAILLEDDEPNSLANALVAISDNAPAGAEVAEVGRRTIERICSAEAVSAAISNFLLR